MGTFTLTDRSKATLAASFLIGMSCFPFIFLNMPLYVVQGWNHLCLFYCYYFSLDRMTLAICTFVTLLFVLCLFCACLSPGITYAISFVDRHAFIFVHDCQFHIP